MVLFDHFISVYCFNRIHDCIQPLSAATSNKTASGDFFQPIVCNSAPILIFFVGH